MSQNLWQKCLVQLKNNLSDYEFNMWILPLQAIVFTDSIELYAPNKFVVNYVYENYLSLINKSLFFFCNKNSIPTVNLFVGSKNLDENSFLSVNKKLYLKDKFSLNFLNFKKFNNCNLLDKYTFNNFIYSESNFIVYKELLNICNFPLTNYRSIYLYSNTGLGKTHLLHAIGNNVNSLFNFKKHVIYITSERFVSKMVYSLYNNSIEEFKLYFRSADILLIDDIQFFSNKEHSQEEFLYIISALLDKNSFIVVTSNVHIKKMNGINNRLMSKLLCGLVINIKKPDFKLRYRFLVKKTKEMSFFLGKNIIKFIAKNVFNNISELEGALNIVFVNTIYFNYLNNINIDFVKNILYDLIGVYDKKINISDIQEIVSNYYKLSLSDLLSRSRYKSLIYPRQISIAISKKLTNYSLSELGKFFGGLDHSTILYSCKKISRLCITNHNVKSDFKNLIKLISNF